MQFEISKSAILKALSNVNGAVEKRNTIPVLLNVKMEAKNGKLNLTATDMDIVIISSSPAIIKKKEPQQFPPNYFTILLEKFLMGLILKLQLLKIIYQLKSLTINQDSPCRALIHLNFRSYPKVI